MGRYSALANNSFGQLGIASIPFLQLWQQLQVKGFYQYQQTVEQGFIQRSRKKEIHWKYARRGLFSTLVGEAGPELVASLIRLKEARR